MWSEWSPGLPSLLQPAGPRACCSPFSSCPRLSLCACSCLCLDFLPLLLPPFQSSKAQPRNHLLQEVYLTSTLTPHHHPCSPHLVPAQPFSLPWVQNCLRNFCFPSLSAQMPGELAEQSTGPSWEPRGPLPSLPARLAGSSPTVSVNLGADLSLAHWSLSADRGRGCCDSGSGC